MASGLQTLLGQAFGAKQYHMMGIYLQRAWIVLTTTTTILLPRYFFATPIFKAIGQEEDIARVTGMISKWLIPVAYAIIPSCTCQMYLQAQSKNVIIAYLAAATLVIHIFLSWLLTVKFAFGLPGAMISTILAFWIPNCGQLLFVMFGGCKETWTGFSFFAFKDLLPVIKLSFSAGAMWLGNDDIFWFYGCSKCSGSKQAGKGECKGSSINCVVLTSFAFGVVLFMFFLFLRGNLAYLFTDSHDVVQAVDKLSPLLAVSILLNSVQPVLSGVAVGAGWQSTVAYVNLGCYYLIGIPVGVVLGYVIKLQGVWIGMLFGTFVQTIVLLVITCKTDWDKQVANAQKRVRGFVIEPAESGDAKGQDA